MIFSIFTVFLALPTVPRCVVFVVLKVVILHLTKIVCAIYAYFFQVNETELLPVMVFFHGGSNVYGSGSIYYGHLIAQHGVVLVTINYRLGMLGKGKAIH